jgi:3-oxoacyl-[acyl-carrier-protein] synthase II
MPAIHDKFGRPVVVVTGSGIVTSLGAGKTDNWKRLTAGNSGIHAITRFATDGLKTEIAGTIDYLTTEPVSAPDMAERLAEIAIEEAIAQSGLGSRGHFPGPLFLAVAPNELEWPQRAALARASGANETVGYDDLLRAAASGHFRSYHERFRFGSVGEALADKFGTEGSPISLSTACASGASAIQLGLEAIRRGETDAALCVATDGSINVESLVRFSLLSALSVQNDPPEAAAKPFSKNRDGFIMAEGAGAMVSRATSQRFPEGRAFSVPSPAAVSSSRSSARPSATSRRPRRPPPSSAGPSATTCPGSANAMIAPPGRGPPGPAAVPVATATNCRPFTA